MYTSHIHKDMYLLHYSNYSKYCNIPVVKVEHCCFLSKMVLNIKKSQDYADHNIPEASQTACKNIKKIKP